MTGIEWTDKTWNPVTGCTKVSPGCRNCYAEGVANRFWGDRSFDQIQFHPERLQQPLKWRKPQQIFVNSMSDLFHERVTDEQLDQVFAVMALAAQHTYQVLTKRPKRMLEYVDGLTTKSGARRFSDAIAHHEADSSLGKAPKLLIHNLTALGGSCLPLPNVWLGTSVENQATANEREPLLRQTPAAVKFLSCEPLLEPVKLCLEGIDWVIIGGESGPKARPCDVRWIKDIAEQCGKAGIKCFVKQLGSNPILDVEVSGPSKRGKNNDPAKWPEVIRVQEFPLKNEF